MKKILAVGLLLIASGNVYSGLEELTLKDCKNKEESRLCVESGEDINTLKFTLNNKISAVKVTFYPTHQSYSINVKYLAMIIGGVLTNHLRHKVSMNYQMEYILLKTTGVNIRKV